MNALFDTNILIDYLNGSHAAKRELASHRHRLISIVTWMEVLAGSRTDEEADVIEMFLRDFRVVELTRGVARALRLVTAFFELAVFVTCCFFAAGFFVWALATGTAKAANNASKPTTLKACWRVNLSIV